MGRAKAPAGAKSRAASRPIEDGELELRTFKMEDLHPYYMNPNQGDVPSVAESLNVTGLYRPIVVNLGTLTGRPNEVLCGNTTWEASRRLKRPTIQATVIDVDDDVAAQIVIKDNQLARLGQIDRDVLAEVLSGIENPVGLGFTAAEVAQLLSALEEPVALTDVDDVDDEVPDVPVSKLGDVWVLGPHRVLCGKAEDLGAVAAMLARARYVPDAVWTDPPYGVDYVGGTKEALTIQNDSLDGLGALLEGAFATIVEVCRPGAPVYVAHADTARMLFEGKLRESGILVRQNLVWVKNALVLGHADYHYRHEPILVGTTPAPEPDPEDDHAGVLYGFVPGGSGRLGRGGPWWFGDNRPSTVFEVPKPRRNEAHPTMKPVQLVRDQLVNSLPPGGVVLDLFGGSGSTLIAAHHLKSRAVLVELDPRYVDAICRRWEQHTGQVPVLEATGEAVSFAPAPAA